MRPLQDRTKVSTKAIWQEMTVFYRQFDVSQLWLSSQWCYQVSRGGRRRKWGNPPRSSTWNTVVPFPKRYSQTPRAVTRGYFRIVNSHSLLISSRYVSGSRDPIRFHYPLLIPRTGHPHYRGYRSSYNATPPLRSLIICIFMIILCASRGSANRIYWKVKRNSTTPNVYRAVFINTQFSRDQYAETGIAHPTG